MAILQYAEYATISYNFVLRQTRPASALFGLKHRPSEKGNVMSERVNKQTNRRRTNKRHFFFFISFRELIVNSCHVCGGSSFFLNSTYFSFAQHNNFICCCWPLFVFSLQLHTVCTSTNTQNTLIRMKSPNKLYM